jgi:MarR family transcriptional regulator, organic hydroperoxide resistance regulator
VTGARAAAARSNTRPAKRGAAHARGRPAGSAPSRAESADIDTLRLLQHWRHRVPDDRFAHLVKDATRALVRALQRRLAPHGVSFGHWAFLRILWESDGLTQRELSREAGVMEPTTFGALKAMESRGYIARRQLPGNRRKTHIFLTGKGRSLERELVPLAEEVNRIAVRGVPARDIVATRRTLLALLKSLARDEAGMGADPSTRKEPRAASRTRRPRGRA